LRSFALVFEYGLCQRVVVYRAFRIAGDVAGYREPFPDLCNHCCGITGFEFGLGVNGDGSPTSFLLNITVFLEYLAQAVILPGLPYHPY
jgi:hypothetical protein